MSPISKRKNNKFCKSSALFFYNLCEHHRKKFPFATLFGGRKHTDKFSFFAHPNLGVVPKTPQRSSPTVEPRSTDTRFTRTVSFVPTKVHIFSLKLTRFIRTPVNTDNGHFSVSRVTNSHILSTPLYGHWLSAHCLFSLSQLCDNCRHCTLFK